MMYKSQTNKMQKPFLYNLVFYTLFFIVISLCVFYPFYSAGRTLVWEADGATQYILRLQYSGTWIRKVLASVFSGHPSVPFYDFTIGTGDDIFLFIKQYPILFLGSIFVNQKNVAIVYTILSIIHIYLMGISFSLFARHKGLSLPSSICGALIYCFSGFTFYFILRHPQFASGAIYFPLLLTGLSNTVNKGGKEKRYLFPLITALSLSSGYYFHYMNSIVLFLYMFFKLILYRKDPIIKKGLVHAVIQYSIGCGLAAFSFLPSVSILFQSGRNVLSNSSFVSKALGSLPRLTKLFSIKKLIELPAVLITPVNLSSSPASFFVCALVIPSIILLFTSKSRPEERERDLLLKISILLSLIGLCVPIITRIFTGSSADYNRWAYIVVFILAFTTAVEIEHLSWLDKRQLLLLFVCVILYAFMYYFIYIYEDVYLISFSFIPLLLVCCCLVRFKRKAGVYLFLFLGVINLMWNGFYFNRIQAGSDISAFLTSKDVKYYYKNSPYQTAARIEEPSFARFDVPDLDVYELNGATPANVKGIACYNSFINKNLISLLKNTENTGLKSPNTIAGVDQRSALENLLAVKYIIAGQGRVSNPPHDFVEDKELEEKLHTKDHIFVNQNPVGIGCTYSEAISEKDYQNLSSLDKQEALLQYAVLPDEEAKKHASDVKQTETENLNSRAVSLPLHINKMDSFITKNGNQYNVDSFDCDEDPFLYYYEVEDLSMLNGIHFETKVTEPCDLYIRISGLSARNQLASVINLDTQEMHTTISFHGKKSNYSAGLKDFTVYMGYYDKPQKISGVISFTADDLYTIDEIQAFSISTDLHQDLLDKRTSHLLSESKIYDNTVTCNVPNNQNHYVVFSIIYKKGWKAYVDGSEVPLYRCNDCFMGVDLGGFDDSKHVIKLKYRPYGLYPGIAISALFLALLIVYLKISRARARQNI